MNMAITTFFKINFYLSLLNTLNYHSLNMKNLKFLLFAVAMLLTVCVQAENKPETVANVTPEPVVAKVSAEPADVEQTPCAFS